MAHSNEPNEQERRKDLRHKYDWNQFKNYELFGFLFSRSKLHLLITIGEILARGIVLENLR